MGNPRWFSWCEGPEELPEFCTHITLLFYSAQSFPALLHVDFYIRVYFIFTTFFFSCCPKFPFFFILKLVLPSIKLVDDKFPHYVMPFFDINSPSLLKKVLSIIFILTHFYPILHFFSLLWTLRETYSCTAGLIA